MWKSHYLVPAGMISWNIYSIHLNSRPYSSMLLFLIIQITMSDGYILNLITYTCKQLSQYRPHTHTQTHAHTHTHTIFVHAYTHTHGRHAFCNTVINTETGIQNCCLSVTHQPTIWPRNKTSFYFILPTLNGNVVRYTKYYNCTLQRVSVTTDSQALHRSQCLAGRQPNLGNLCTVKEHSNQSANNTLHI